MQMSCVLFSTIQYNKGNRMTQQKDEMLLIGLIEADKLTMIIVILEAI